MCHEVAPYVQPPVSAGTDPPCDPQLAHIDQMNHSHAFQKVNKEIRADLSKLRAKGYTGDGFWSGGRALTGGKDDVPMGDDEQPNYAWCAPFAVLRARSLMRDWSSMQWWSDEAQPQAHAASGRSRSSSPAGFRQDGSDGPPNCDPEEGRRASHQGWRVPGRGERPQRGARDELLSVRLAT